MESYESQRRKALSFVLRMIWSSKTQDQLTSTAVFCNLWLKWTKKEIYRPVLREHISLQEKFISEKLNRRYHPGSGFGCIQLPLFSSATILD